MSVQSKHRFTVTDYYRMAETGVLRPGARVELLNGEIIDMSPIGPFHGGVANQLNQIFTVAANGRWLTAVQNPIHLDDHSEPQPDLMLLKPVPDFYRKRHPQPEDVFLLVEVSDTTLAADRANKLPAYGRAGIKEVWIVNLEEQIIEAYREPHFNGYSSKKIIAPGANAEILAFSSVTVNVADLLKR